MMNQPEPVTLYAGRFLHLKTRGTWEYVQRPNTTGVVGVAAVTQEGKLLLVEQYRPAVNCNVIELPAGLAGDQKGQEHEDLTVAARRELLEETGYETDSMEQFLTGASSAGLTTETVTLCIARGLRKVHAGGGDADERIIVHEIPVDQVIPWLKSQQALGKLIDFKILAALYLHQQG